MYGIFAEWMHEKWMIREAPRTMHEGWQVCWREAILSNPMR